MVFNQGDGLALSRSSVNPYKTDSIDSFYHKVILKYDVFNNGERPKKHVLLKKYGENGTAPFTQIFQAVEQHSIDKNLPVIYIGLDQELLNLYKQDDPSEFERKLAEEIARSVKKTRPNSPDYQSPPIAHEDFRDSLDHTLKGMGLGGSYVSEGAIPLIDITALPIYSQESRFSANSEDIIRNWDTYEELAGYSLRIIDDLKNRENKTVVAVPGWLIDTIPKLQEFFRDNTDFLLKLGDRFDKVRQPALIPTFNVAERYIVIPMGH